MIYHTIDTLPYKDFIKMIDSDNYSLMLNKSLENIMSGEQFKCSSEELKAQWDLLYKTVEKTHHKNESNKILRIQKEVAAYNGKYNAVILACRALEFGYSGEMIKLLKDFGYRFNESKYYEAIEKIQRESKALLIKAKDLQSKIPKQDDDSGDQSIDDVLACFSSILSIDFDYNKVSVSKFYSLEKQVEAKVKALETQLNKQQSTNRRIYKS